jgi:sensitive to high expression protein 9
VVAGIRGDVGHEEEEASLDVSELQRPREMFQIQKLETWKAALLDLFSDRAVSMRKQDVTLITLEGAATGAALVGIIATLILRHP